MNDPDPSEERPDAVGELRGRAARCRAYASEYSSDIGLSLHAIAAELEAEADRLESVMAARPPMPPAMER